MARYLTVTNLIKLTLWLFLLVAAPSFLHAQNLPVTEKQKIEALIKQVGDLKEAKFIRNGSTYEVASAVRFLHGKWDANAAEVKSARDFIDKVASTFSQNSKSSNRNLWPVFSTRFEPRTVTWNSHRQVKVSCSHVK